MAVQPTDKVIAVAVGTTFAVLVVGTFLMSLHCQLALNQTGLERTVCGDRSSFALGALFVVAVPIAMLVPGWISRRTGWQFVFYGAWATGVLFGLAVGITAFA